MTELDKKTIFSKKNSGEALLTIIMVSLTYFARISDAGPVSDRQSVPSVGDSFRDCTYNVKLKLELENYSSEELTVHQNMINAREVPNPPLHIKPGMNEAFFRP